MAKDKFPNSFKKTPYRILCAIIGIMSARFILEHYQNRNSSQWRKHEHKKIHRKNNPADRGLHLEAAHRLRVPALFRQPLPAVIQYRRLPHCGKFPRQQCARRRQLLWKPYFSDGRVFSGNRHGRGRCHRPLLRRAENRRSAESRPHDGCFRTGCGYLFNRCGYPADFPHPHMDGNACRCAAGIHGLFPHLLPRLPVLCHVQCLRRHFAVHRGQPSPAHLSDCVLRHQHCAGLTVYRRAWFRRRRCRPRHDSFPVYQRVFMSLAADPQKPGGLPRILTVRPF